jgi:hypothetical protein
MTKEKINYKDIIALGFKRQDENDSVFYDENGYDWFIVTKRISKSFYMNWDCETHFVELIREKKGDILNRIDLINLDAVKGMIDFFTKTNSKKGEDNNYIYQTS